MNTLLALLKPTPQSVQDAGGDLDLRREYLSLKEEEAMGNIPELPPYDVWKAQRIGGQNSAATLMK